MDGVQPKEVSVANLALQQGSLRFTLVEPDALAYTRTYTHADGRQERTLVLASRLSKAHPVKLTLPPGEWRDAMTGEVVSHGGEVELEAAGGRVVVG